MKKYMKGMLAVIGIVISLALGWYLGMTVDATEETESSVEDVKASDMFYRYPYYLKSQAGKRSPGGPWSADYYVVEASDLAYQCIGAMAEDRGDLVAAIITSFQNGNFVLEEALTIMGLESFETKCINTATRQLLMATMQDRELMGAVFEENENLEEAWGHLKNGTDLMESLIFEGVSEAKKTTISKALEQRNHLFEAGNLAIDAVQMGSFIYFMESVNEDMLDYLVKNIDDPKLKENLLKHQEYKDSYYLDYILSNYLDDNLADDFADACVEALEVDGYAPHMLIAEYFWKAYGEILSNISGVGDAEKLIVAMKLGDYARSIQTLKNELIGKMQTEPVMPEDILEYKLVYDMYVASVRAFASATKEVDSYYESSLNEAIKNIDNNVSFTKHLKGCKKAVEADANAADHAVRINPDKYYFLTEGMKLSDSSDTLEEDTIYFAGGLLSYGLRVAGDFVFPEAMDNQERAINGDLIIYRGTVTIPEGLELYVSGDLTGEQYIIGPSIDNCIRVSGSLEVAGKMTESGPHNYTSIVMNHEDAVLKVGGDVNIRGSWDISAGKIHFKGSSISAEKLAEVGNAEIKLETDGAGEVLFNCWNLKEREKLPINMVITQNENSDYVMTGEAAGHILYVYNLNKKLYVPEKLKLESLYVGSQYDDQAEMTVDGIVEVLRDVELRRAKLNINGTMTVGGSVMGSKDDYRQSTIYNRINLNGNLDIKGDFKETGTRDFTGITMNDEKAALRIGGNVDVCGTWDILAKQVDIAGDVNCTGRWNVTSGQMNFTGGTVVLSGMGDLGKASLFINSSGEGNVELAVIKFVKEEDNPLTLALTQEEDKTYIMKVNAPGHTMNIYDHNTVINIQVPETMKVKNMFIGHYGDDKVGMTVDGAAQVIGNVELRRAKLNINGTMTVGGSVMGSKDDIRQSTIYNRINLNGNLDIKGDFKETGTRDHTGITMNDEKAALRIGGNISCAGNWDVNAGEVHLAGTKEQTMEFGWIARNSLKNLTIDNTSDQGVTFKSAINMTGLFNHNRKNFTLYNDGQGSVFIDYDKDGVTDEKDPYPMDADISAYKLIISPIKMQTYEGKAIEPEVIVTDAGGERLTLGKDYEISFENNDKPGTAKVIITGKGVYEGTYESEFEIVDVTPGVELDQSELTVEEWKTAELELSYKMIEDPQILWESSNPEVATVSQEGIVTAVKPGEAVITVSVNEFTASCKVTVKEHTHEPSLLHSFVQMPNCQHGAILKKLCVHCDYAFDDTMIETFKLPHTYKNVVTKATTKANGKIESKCSRRECGHVEKTTVIDKPSKMTLSTTTYTYNGSVKKPTVKVTDSKGKTISSSDYTITYPGGRKNVGKYTVKVTFKGNYSGTMSASFVINPKSTSVSSLSKANKAFTVKWKKEATQVTGYQIQYAANKKFTSAKTVTISSQKTISKKITKLKAKTTYYVRVRTYKTVGSTKFYSGWSSAKSVKTK